MFFSANSGRNLTVGLKGQDVWALQVYLITNNILAPTGPAGSKLTNPTGYFGALTKNALAEYQAQAGISPASGLLGPKTHAYLENLSGGTAPAVVSSPTPVTAPTPQPASSASSLSYGDTGSGVVNLQTVLVGNGFLSPGTYTEGTFDGATLHAVETFQCFEKIACSDATPGYGTVGPKTRGDLGL